MNDQIKKDYKRETGKDSIEREHHDPDDEMKLIDLLGIVVYCLVLVLLVYNCSGL